MSSEKTEQPTEHKIRKAREEGQVAKSKDFTQTLLMGSLLGYMLADAEAIIKNFVEMIVLPSQLYGMDFKDAVRVAIDQCLLMSVKLLLPFILLVIVIGIFSEMIQTGPLLAFKALIPKGDKLNPASNLQQMFSMKNFVEFFKSILKVCFLSAIIFFVLKDSLQPLLLIPASGLAAAGVAVADMLKTLVIYSFIGFGALSLCDLIWQRYQHRKNLMMSMDEIKQEYKQLEGDPHVKSHRKGLAKEIAMGEMVLKTRKSSVVVTNPTHLAIALYYEPSVTPLPVVLAKGQDGVAFQMVDMAKQYGIPVMQNINLARALMSFAKIDQYIPSDLIEPVAELLVALRRLSNNEAAGGAN
jgi:type III secretion protein U